MSKQVVVLGGGFSGVEAAISLSKFGHRVILVSNRDYLFLYPTSIWVPVNIKKFEEVILPLDQLKRKHGFEVVVDHFTAIDTSGNTVRFGSREIAYDYLVLAIGMGKLKPKGVEFTHSICGDPEEGITIREELEKLIRRGSGNIAVGFGGNPRDKTGVRGGPAFELMFNISHYLKKRGVRKHFNITFFAPMPEPGKRMGPNVMKKMPAYFRHYGIDSKTGVKINAFEKDGVLFEDGSKLACDLILFIPGGTGHPALKGSALPLNDTGFIKIDDHCKVEGLENVYATGDVAALEGPDWAAKQGHTAEVMAQVAAFNIHQHIQGSNERRGYQKHLNIICVMDSGDGAAFVYRKDDRSLMIPMPLVGHWMKKGWGFYYRNSRLGRIPRIPGM